MTFGTKLRRLRDKNRLSQQEVSDLLGVKQNTYSRWESDYSTFKVEYLVKLAEIFKVNPVELLPEDNLPKKESGVNQKTDNSNIAIQNKMDKKEIFEELIESKNELIRFLKEENERLKSNKN